MRSEFYAGHSMEWMDRFVNAIPKGLQLRRGTVVGIASAIHHQFTLSKKEDITLSHSILEYFAVNPRCIKPYLLLFKKEGLIDVVFKKGASPKVKLLCLPQYRKTLINNNKRNLHQISHVPTPNRSGFKKNIKKGRNGGSKSGSQGYKGTKGARDRREQGVGISKTRERVKGRRV